MPDEGPLEHYLTVSHEPEPDIPEPAPERSPGPWRERGIMLGLGFLLGCIGAYALVYSEMSGGMRSLKQSLSEERDSNASLQKERAHLLETLEQARVDALLKERSPLSVTVGGVPRLRRGPADQSGGGGLEGTLPVRRFAIQPGGGGLQQVEETLHEPGGPERCSRRTGDGSPVLQSSAERYPCGGSQAG